jgi:predicted RND superfamily exporter protein
VVAVTLGLAAQIPRLSIDTSTNGFMIIDDPARKDYDTFKQKFGSDTITLIMVKADDVFTAPVLETIRRLSDAVERLDHVSRVESLTTVTNIKGEGDSLTTEPLVGASVPRAAAALASIRSDALSNRVLVGNLVSADARATAIVIYTDADPADTAFNDRFTAQVEDLIARETRSGLTIYQIGGPLVDATLGRDILRDMLTFVPLSFAVLFFFLFFFFRTVQGVLAPLATGVISIVWALGAMALFGLPVTILTAVVPALMIVIGSTEDVHMITEYYHLLEEGRDQRTALHTMLQQATLPVLITTATTVVGFGSMVVSNIPVQIHFGYASVLGLTANFIVTLVALPALLAITPIPRRFREPNRAHARGGPGALMGLLPRLAEFDLRYRAPIAGVAGLLMVGALVGWFTLRVNTDVFTLFPESSVIRQRFQDVHRSLTGFGVFYVEVDTGHPDGARSPEVLEKIANLQDFLAGRREIDKTTSVADYVRKMHREMNSGDPAFETIPDSREAIAQYLLLLEGTELAKHLDFNAATASVLVRHHMTGSWEYAALLGRLQAYLAEHFTGSITARSTGEAMLLHNAADYLAINELTSFSLTFVIIGLIHGLFFRSVKVGVLSLIPNVIPVLLVYGIMGLLGIPLNLGTAMIATIAIGVAVDDTVHHVVTFKRQLALHQDRRVAVAATIRIQGPPIVYVSVALAGGFLVFVFSSFVPVIHYGVLSSLVMLIAMVGELVLTPVMMYWAAPLRGLSPATSVGANTAEVRAKP